MSLHPCFAWSHNTYPVHKALPLSGKICSSTGKNLNLKSYFPSISHKFAPGLGSLSTELISNDLRHFDCLSAFLLLAHLPIIFILVCHLKKELQWLGDFNFYTWKRIFEGEVNKMLKTVSPLCSWFLPNLTCNCAEIVLHLTQNLVNLAEIIPPCFLYSNKQKWKVMFLKYVHFLLSHMNPQIFLLRFEKPDIGENQKEGTGWSTESLFNSVSWLGLLDFMSASLEIGAAICFYQL